MRDTNVQKADCDDTFFSPETPLMGTAKDLSLEGPEDSTDAARTLMSPPPEETLRARHNSTPRSISLTASNKRKRVRPEGHAPEPDSPTAPATPNPKSRKQHRSQSPIKPILFSPHAENPKANYFPAAMDNKSRRRSQTPVIPPYEPPSRDSLTPAPRQVIVSPAPPPSTSKRRAGQSRQSKALPKIQIPIKKEMPEIDLNAPMPPASPTDDPLLLRGPVLPSPRKLVSVGVGAQDAPIDVDALRDEDVQTAQFVAYPDPQIEEGTSDIQVDIQPPSSAPNSSPPPSSPAHLSSSFAPVFPFLAHASEDVVNDFSSSSADRSMDDDADAAELESLPLPPARPPRPSEITPAYLEANDGWPSSDDEGGKDDEVSEGESDYTGQWRTLAVRTKRDPPSAATVARMARWGRPISPFPYPRRKSDASTGAGGDQDESILDGPEFSSEALPGSPTVANNKQREDVRSAMAHLDSMPKTPTASAVPLLAPGTPNQHLRSFLRARSRSRTPGPTSTEVQQSPVHPSRATSLPPLPESSPVVDRQTGAEAGMVARAPGASAEGAGHWQERHAASSRPVPADASTQSSTTSDSGQYHDGTTPVPDNAPQVSYTDNDKLDAPGAGAEDAALRGGPGCVTISSKDNLAAAKCIAILRQHNYDVMIREAQQKRRRASSTTALHDISRASYRRSLLGSGVQKTRSASRSPFKDPSFWSSPSRNNSWTIGDMGHTSTPAQRGADGEPCSPMTYGELMTVAEAAVSPRCKSPSVAGSRRSTSFATELGGDGEADWTKDHWKLLDACFTTERISVALGGADTWDPSDDHPPLAHVDEVELERVVDRFCEQAGGDQWRRDALLRRASALRNKQRAGNIAPPTPSRGYRAGSTDASSFPQVCPDYQRFSTPVRDTSAVPDFTPLPIRAPLLRHTSVKSIASEHNDAELGTRPVSPALLNPRYSHLLDEAKNISVDEEDDDDEDAAEVNRSLSMEPEDDHDDEQGPRPAKGLKGFLYSYLPKSFTPNRRLKAAPNQDLRKCLPPPPPLGPRGPIETPERPPLPSTVPPKALVELHEAPPPTKLPRPAARPRRMVELQHVPSPQQWDSRLFTLKPRERKDSGGSVKDLIKSFEEMDKAKKAAKLKASSQAKPAWK
ncbi:hypothetical protein BD626DRAFT_515027 [Schizophyllum amplum]|uniref:Uncharacterized protein n=1 Tax=Schizophyllum amplum TaxID=97359 RepID=A0A550BY84_9AGAR|nr:hypothetical protein BD626DRAFT_515027 [Auriculariopsis ampla]